MPLFCSSCEKILDEGGRPPAICERCPSPLGKEPSREEEQLFDEEASISKPFPVSIPMPSVSKGSGS